VLFATHIVGGEIYYDYLGNDVYKIHMKVYRDCINGIPPLDGFPDANGNIQSNAVFTVFDANGNVVSSHNFNTVSVTLIPPSINNPCIVPQNNVCVQEGVYEYTLTLPPITGGYYIAYQRCCRNNTILNLISPGDVGATYWEHIPGPEIVPNNNSPRFNLFPPIYICNGLPINFNHSATDPDGDVLVYSLCTPFNGLDACCPLIGSNPPGAATTQCPNPPGSCPQVNTPPPYVSVPFIAPYSSSYPMATNPAININPNTGLLNGTPTINGQWVVGVCVSEYRNGVLIGTHHRDFQFNVIPCVINVVSAIQNQTQFCAGLTVDFGNQSFGNNGNLTYYWDFGDPNILIDNSTSLSPSYTYPVPGTYTVMLIATQQPGGCSDTSYNVFDVQPLLDIDFDAPDGGQCLVVNNFTFNGGGNYQGTGTISWDFGANATPQTANSATVTNVSFNAPGRYPITFRVSENGCEQFITDTVTVYQMPTASFSATPIAGCDPLEVQFANSSTADTPMSYLWQFSNGATSTDQNPNYIFTPPGVYSVTLTITTSNGCITTQSFVANNMITVSPSPIASFSATPMVTSIFEPDIYFTNTGNETGITEWYYNFGDGNSSNLVNPSHSYTNWGDYTVTQTIINEYGCPNTYTLEIKILPEFRFWIPNAFTPGNNDGLNDVFKPVVMGVENYTFMIFNRWGELIYKTNHIDEGWNGTYMGKKSQMDVYVWKCEFKNLVSKLYESHIGHVTLVR